MKTGQQPQANDGLKSLPLSEVEQKLESSPEGLTQAEAEKRLAQYGPNEIIEKETSPLLQFLSYFWGPIPWMIEAAVVLSAVAQHWVDFFIILILLLTKAVVGFWEEHQADNAIYSGSIVPQGEIGAMIYATGANTIGTSSDTRFL
ncbi:cation-transporting P-type ATPase [Gimesia algae]|uniref:Calcium-transporting ATPase n=1 Tax=Gimesia algae TaxID=2527971 RepID=A0A517VKX3_9PLAN|nr:cation-transporting P-type ATPase [Gimesia algae]QDT93673.1 Calcium-transporting ATPase [Gimesia algae]